MVGRKRKRWFATALVLLAAGLLLGGAAAWTVAGQLVAPQPCVVGNPPPDLAANAISLISRSGGRLAGWHIPSDFREGVVVLLHGIRSSRLSMLDRARMLVAAGYSVVMIDFQSHGESTGDRITAGYLERHDVRAAVAFARRMHPGEPVAVIGVSMGGAAALLASSPGLDALVLESVYPDLRAAVRNRVARRLGFLAAIPTQLLLVQFEPRLGISPSRMRPADRLAEVGCPVFLVSGSDDPYTTADETRSMYAAARPPKQLWLMDGAGHEDLYRASPAEYKVRVLDFLRRSLQAAR